MPGKASVIDAAVVFLARLLGGGSLLLLLVGGVGLVRLQLPDGAALAWDAGLSLAFFVQHSLMVRRSVKARMARHLPARYLGAVYAMASGIVLAAVALLWQRTGGRILLVEGPARWLLHLVDGLALAGFAWGVVSLRHFDPFGVRPIRLHALGRTEPPSVLTVRGPYRWVRHPLYLVVLVLLWASPVVTADRLLLDVLWTAWIVAGTILEERDLLAEFGAPYHDYQRRVPMLVPWRGPVG